MCDRKSFRFDHKLIGALEKRKEERCVRFVITVVTGQRQLIFYSDHIVVIAMALY